MREESESGYPYRSEKAIASLFNGITEMRQQPTSYTKILNLLITRLQQCIYNAREHLTLNQDVESKFNFESEIRSNIVWNLDAAEESIKKGDNPRNEKDLVIFAFDEARHLLDEKNLSYEGGINKFRLLRRAARLLAENHKETNFFMIFVDTSSKIQNFSPPEEEDPSKRHFRCWNNIPGELFHPFILLETFDVLFTQLQANTMDLSELAESKEYLKAGRPGLDIESYNIESNTSALDNLVSKLNNGRYPFLANDTESCLSMILCRVSASINAVHHFASVLVAKNMATLHATDKTRSLVMMSYSPEPKLALASAKKVKKIVFYRSSK